MPARSLDPALPPAAVYDGLDADVRSLVDAVHALYAGDFEDCAEDLRRRRAGRPYLYRLKVEVPDDLAWLSHLKSYVAARGEGFAAVVPAPGPAGMPASS